MYKIVNRRRLGDIIYLHEIEAPKVAKVAEAGQFVILRKDEFGERIPMTISNYDREKGTITIVFQVAGYTTSSFRDMTVGDSYRNVVGPLGNATHSAKGTIVCVGGGTGIAISLPIAKKMKAQGNRVISIIGARTRDLLILKDEVEQASSELIVCTDDGSAGRKGFVTQALADVIAREKVDEVFAIGPVIMMKMICGVTKEPGIKTTVSLNPVMIDGTGMCGACRVEVAGKIKYACTEGPEFDGHQVNFDLLMTRLKGLVDEEAQSVEHHKKCQYGR
jgi:ferredoxin--NADP+ reductase